jgi:hypothetical protein
MKTIQQIKDRIRIIESQIKDAEDSMIGYLPEDQEWQDSVQEVLDLHHDLRMLNWVLED